MFSGESVHQFQAWQSGCRLVQVNAEWLWRHHPGTLREDGAAVWDSPNGRGTGRQTVSVLEKCIQAPGGISKKDRVSQRFIEQICWINLFFIHFCLYIHRLVFSQSLISLDMIEDFLDLTNKAKNNRQSSLYKGTSPVGFSNVIVLQKKMHLHSLLLCNIFFISFSKL